MSDYFLTFEIRTGFLKNFQIFSTDNWFVSGFNAGLLPQNT